MIGILNNSTNSNIKIIILSAISLVLIVTGIFLFYWSQVSRDERLVISSFEECVGAGFPVQESYPRSCTTPDGQTFSEDVSKTENMDSESENIKVDSPTPNDVIESPLIISGEAVGTWMFEANMSVTLYDNDGNVVSEGNVMAQGDWMTDDMVPFEGTLEFEEQESGKGRLVINKANPSGLEENADEFVVPIYFK